jgi:hypothetical protein
MIIRNISHNDKEVKADIAKLVGPSYSLWKRISMGGNGSPRLVIAAATEAIDKLLSVDNRTRFCNLELRPNGLIMSFRSRLETYAWVLPFSSLTMIRSTGFLELSSHGNHVKLDGFTKSRSAQKFLRKIINAKAAVIESSGGDYYDYQ